MTTFADLPSELSFSVVRKLDIDSRRALGIYTKLKVPPSLAQDISLTFIKPMYITPFSTSQDCSLMMPFYNDDIKDFYLDIMEQDYRDLTNNKLKRVLRIIKSWFTMCQFEVPGLVIRAGMPDGSDLVHISFEILKFDPNYIEYGMGLESFEDTFSF